MKGRPARCEVRLFPGTRSEARGAAICASGLPPSGLWGVEGNRLMRGPGRGGGAGGAFADVTRGGSPGWRWVGGAVCALAQSPDKPELPGASSDSQLPLSPKKSLQSSGGLTPHPETPPTAARGAAGAPRGCQLDVLRARPLGCQGSKAAALPPAGSPATNTWTGSPGAGQLSQLWFLLPLRLGPEHCPGRLAVRRPGQVPLAPSWGGGVVGSRR